MLDLLPDQVDCLLVLRGVSRNFVDFLAGSRCDLSVLYQVVALGI